MTWNADEQGTESSRPVELYVITTPSTTYRRCSSRDSIVFAGTPAGAVGTYTGGILERNDLDITGVSDAPAFEFVVPFDEQFVTDIGLGMPLQNITLDVYRLQRTSGECKSIHHGKVIDMELMENDLVKIIAPNLLVNGLSKRLPVAIFQSQCNHILYDTQCTIVRASFELSTTVGVVSDNKTFTVASVGGHGDDYYKGGILTHVPTGEQRTIVSQIGTSLVLKDELKTVSGGQSVKIAAGCGHQITDCAVKFSNIDNFGGMPGIPRQNPFDGGLL